MGNTDSKSEFRKCFVDLTTDCKQTDMNNKEFWEKLWLNDEVTVHDIFANIPVQELRALREKCPQVFANLCLRTAEKFISVVNMFSFTQEDTTVVLNCARLLTRIIPFLFEDSDWRNLFWVSLSSSDTNEFQESSIAENLLSALSDSLFIPDFTVQPKKKKGPEGHEDIKVVDSCEYIWEAGVGCVHSPLHNPQFDVHRTEILKLLLVCFSESIYSQPSIECQSHPSRWVTYFTSSKNRHALSLFASLLNTVLSYDPVGYGIPYNYILFYDSRESLVETSLQLLCVTLELPLTNYLRKEKDMEPSDLQVSNLFVDYLSRVHREEDFNFILKGFCRLLNNPFRQTYLPGSSKRISFHQELLIFFWKFCEINKRFLLHVLKSSEVLDVLVPILYYLLESRCDQSKVGLMHIGVFILLLLSGERNFGVRLNKPYVVRSIPDVPTFSGTHADLLIIVYHKIMTAKLGRLQSLYDFLLTTIVNVSPYLKSLNTVSSCKLIHLFEVFSSPWFLLQKEDSPILVSYLLETFNNLIQYQFDGNASLVYTIIRKRQVFFDLSNMPTEQSFIDRILASRDERKAGDNVGKCIQDFAVHTSLLETPDITKITAEQSVSDDSTDIEKESNVKTSTGEWKPNSEWLRKWKQKFHLQTILRLLQVLVPQVEKMCIDKGLTDENEIIQFLHNGTLVGLLPIPHPILIRKYQPNVGTVMWLKTYMWGVIYLRNVDPPIWYETNIMLFEVHRGR